MMAFEVESWETIIEDSIGSNIEAIIRGGKSLVLLYNYIPPLVTPKIYKRSKYRDDIGRWITLSHVVFFHVSDCPSGILASQMLVGKG